MILCVSGDTHGALERLYADVDDFERSLKVRFEGVRGAQGMILRFQD